VTESRLNSLLVDTPVEVMNNSLGCWVAGFSVVHPTRQGYQLRRTSDRAVLPKDFVSAEVRPVRR
jgi:hypothetical protein